MEKNERKNPIGMSSSGKAPYQLNNLTTEIFSYIFSIRWGFKIIKNFDLAQIYFPDSIKM